MKDKVSLHGGEDVEVGKNGVASKDGDQGDSMESSSIGGESSSSPLASSEEKEISKEEEEVESGALGCLDCLEESLPVKRGLSLFFSGKSKSFTSLSDVANMTANDLTKSENSFNKRRRILIANKVRRTSSYRSLIGMSLLSPPPLFQNHISEEAGEADEESQSNKEKNNSKCFGSNRSFSLSDLQHA
ncbi:uncharacterized protein LOC122010512 [Zingiber officinale]|uniref:Uncharacterized protein n=1 Tax=Zingiber officinale TaxID=94328 RepID=A0A8J5FGN1_ZINOF|nr:uncharacterized protein LOC122010512 [Zingiber officinale]KAG6484993.1 hypothetical protein ZIOFF_053519 [Zingiber officinale]